MRQTITIDELIEVVNKGGNVKTGIDVYDKHGLLLLDKDVLVTKVAVLLTIKKAGIRKVPISPENAGGIWDQDGRQINLSSSDSQKDSVKTASVVSSSLEKKVFRIEELKRTASVKYQKAKENFKESVKEIKESGGYFDLGKIRSTVDDLFEFLTANDTAFSYLTKEILSYDEYLYNHSINVCTIGTTILNKFNEYFSTVIKESLGRNPGGRQADFVNFQPQDLRDLSLGYFLHDVGKVLIPEHILNKNGPLTDDEFELIKRHSFENGNEIMNKNRINNHFIRNPALFHHCRLYEEETRCYPEVKNPNEIPVYVKFCKLADIYDALTSKRSYKDAMNPTGVVAKIFRSYADKDKTLQLILHSFVKAVGIYPPGSIVPLRNGQIAYVLDSAGPIAIPFTDGAGRTLKTGNGPLDLGEMEKADRTRAIDRDKPLIRPIDIYDRLPAFVQKSLH